ncbi:hypothetical protein [Sporomusa acidovorans]|uniref:Uncharacterized protein n=1 Tax=Sporomusa acidovorans (strain ATCC 49682 / DSM 3132 / Mol) TaxID=1123286 RepID=A0ABZ3J004_SPOA4|nr:hypothetical protein [Sporomusa acidovorans]OZC24214.1 hypothetical protein SPACI_01040 [Sporomusa acidovorans DSM 3132]SDF55552.1 hypothetical protein SAMN04488499_10582 [Sporomusa acidovorans]
MVKNKDYFIGKWQEQLESDNVLVRYKAKQFIGIMSRTELLTEFDINLYSTLVEKVTVHNGAKLMVSLLDGTDVECIIE